MMIAQLTVTALLSSSVNWAGFGLTMRRDVTPVGVGVRVGAACHDEPTLAAEPGALVQRPRVTPERRTITNG